MAENIFSSEVCCPAPRTLKIQKKFLKSWKTACLKKLRKDDLNKKFRKLRGKKMPKKQLNGNIYF